MAFSTKCLQKLKTVTAIEKLIKHPQSRSFNTSSWSKSVIPRKRSSLPEAETNVKHIVVGSISVGVAIAYLYNNWQNSKQQKDTVPPLLHSSKKPTTARERRFLQFARLEYDGITYMTPKNFLESVVDDEPRQRKKTMLVNHSLADSYVSNIPNKTHGSMFFFRDIGERGLISYPEYLFLLSKITKPRRSFKIAFELIDKNKNDQLSREEFLDFISLAGGCPIHRDHKSKLGQAVNTTLMVHLFGKEGSGKLSFREFGRFMENLQEELFHVEFTEYSRGTGRISEEDLARILLSYTSLTEAEQDSLVAHLHSRMPQEERVGVSFPEYVTLMLLLNNVYELAVMLRMFHLAERSVNKKQFTRAAKICLEQVYEELVGDDERIEEEANKEKLVLSPHIVDVIFYMLDKGGNDDQLNYEELISMIYDRKNKGVRTIIDSEGWEGLQGFIKCIRNETKLEKMQHELY